MVSKNNTRLYQEKMDKKQLRYSLKKLNVGVASVLVGFTFGLGAMTLSAAADTTDVASDNAATTTVAVNDLTGDQATPAALAESKAATTANPYQSTETPDHTQTKPALQSGAAYGNIHSDYKVGWTKPNVSYRPNDPGFALSDDGMTLIYRVAAGDETKLNMNDVLSLLYAQSNNDPSVVVWGTDKRLAENKQTDSSNGVSWKYSSFNYYANNNQAFVFDIVDGNRNGDFSVDLKASTYANLPATKELVIPGDDYSKKVHYNGANFGSSDNESFFQGAKNAMGYLVMTNRVVNRNGYPQDNLGQTLRFAIVPVNAAPLIDVQATAATMGLGAAPFDDQENGVQYYQATPDSVKNIVASNVSAKDYMDDFVGKDVNKQVKITDESGREVTPEQMKEQTLYTVHMTATDSGNLSSAKTMNVVIGKLSAASKAASDLAVNDKGTQLSGKATPGATVTVTDPKGNEIGTSTADDQGNFTVDLATPQTKGQELTVSAQEPGNRPATSMVVAPTIIDKSELEKAINDGTNTQASDNYNNATADDKQALDDAIKNGEAVKNDPKATQAQVDAAQKAIEDAIKNINDKANTPSTKPSDVTAVKDENGTNVTGKAAPNADVTVTDKDGN
ncbi:MAG: Ig-like domain-containing protein, partial [Limosilactobacillus sp.]|nr:Ig-like domain-containing protein [Limosilactobacillus sp.]